MNLRLPRLVFCVATLAAACGILSVASAKTERWTNAKGESFDAAPADIIGPWALFDDSTLLPLNLLSPEDCVRFYKGLLDRPARAANWKDAKSEISYEVYGRLQHYTGNNLVGDNEEGRPEPEFYMVFYTYNDKVQSWDELSRSTPALYSKLIADYPGLVQGVVFGHPEEDMQDFMDVAANTKGEWMFAQFHWEVQMRLLQHLMPTNLYGIVVMTRDGIPLFGPESQTDEQVKSIFEKFNGMLQHARPEDMKGWGARAYYFKNVQPVAFANGKSDPLLIGNPLDEAKLRQMKVFKINATFQVAADGKVTSVEVDPEGLQPGMVDMFTKGFKRGCLFVAAVDHGKFVDGTYKYHMEVKP
jgi:hypothetical protein